MKPSFSQNASACPNVGAGGVWAAVAIGAIESLTPISRPSQQMYRGAPYAFSLTGAPTAFHPEWPTVM